MQRVVDPRSHGPAGGRLRLLRQAGAEYRGALLVGDGGGRGRPPTLGVLGREGLDHLCGAGEARPAAGLLGAGAHPVTGRADDLPQLLRGRGAALHEPARVGEHGVTGLGLLDLCL